MKPVIIPDGTLRPLPEAMRGIACSVCGRRRASWEMTTSHDDRKGEFVCALCWFYRTAWAEENAEVLTEFVAALEELSGRPFAKSEEGRLVSTAEADTILGALAMTSRLFSIRSPK